jgi:hypothetical protein
MKKYIVCFLLAALELTLAVAACVPQDVCHDASACESDGTAEAACAAVLPGGQIVLICEDTNPSDPEGQCVSTEVSSHCDDDGRVFDGRVWCCP